MGQSPPHQRPSYHTMWRENFPETDLYTGTPDDFHWTKLNRYSCQFGSSNQDLCLQTDSPEEIFIWGAVHQFICVWKFCVQVWRWRNHSLTFTQHWEQFWVSILPMDKVGLVVGQGISVWWQPQSEEGSLWSVFGFRLVSIHQDIAIAGGSWWRHETLNLLGLDQWGTGTSNGGMKWGRKKGIVKF